MKVVQAKNEEATAGWRESHGDSARRTCAGPAKVSGQLQVRHSCWPTRCSFRQRRQGPRVLPAPDAPVDSLVPLER